MKAAADQTAMRRPRTHFFTASDRTARAARRIALSLVLVAAFALTALAQAPDPALRSEAYTWKNVAIGGGGFVTGLLFHPQQRDLLYARTDVGGAYRWDTGAGLWVPLTDWLGAGEAGLAGIESFAVDPADPERVYLAAGAYVRGDAEIFRSTDRGRTWRRARVPFKMGANELGRFNGERLAVDPNDGNVLYFGSRRDGLWRSADRGATWSKLDGFPATELSEPNSGSNVSSRVRLNPFAQVGIVFVHLDARSSARGQPARTIYAGVSTAQTNFFRSDDAGVTWRPVAGQPVGLRPNHLVAAADGVFYLTYGREPGPNTMTDGAVWKFHSGTGAWTDITPAKPSDAGQPFGYGAVAVDARRPSTVMVATFCRWNPRDEIFRSTNAGASWQPLLSAARWDLTTAPYTAERTPHWIGDVEIDPFNSDRALFTTGYGAWCCTNASAADSGEPTRWMFFNNGLEETVPLTLISPPEGAPLLSGVGDIDGFRHDDLTISPPQGTFAGPRYSNTEDMAFAGRKPLTLVRAGTARSGRETVRAAISIDGGGHWSALASEPPLSAGAGTIAVSADGQTIVWTPRRTQPHVSADRGGHWTACTGLAPGIRVIADTVNSDRFYAADPRSGKLFCSTNGARDFTAAAAMFPGSEGYGNDAQLVATPGVAGDLWLASRSAGLFHSTDGGATLTKIAAVNSAESLGLGKAPAGRMFPALYLFGTIQSLQALFRSDDAGATWMRINDDPHQFGWINHVTGDPRLYGRVYFGTGGRGILYGDPAGQTLSGIH